MKYLIVDDNEQFRAYLREILLKPEDECRELDDGSGVNEAYREFRPDWVLLDIRMPKINGFEAGRRLKQSYPEARFITISNYSDARFRQMAQQIGAAAFVAKDNLEALPEIILQTPRSCPEDFTNIERMPQ
jgi:DNA-binding NarL/FixJ family response regulator